MATPPPTNPTVTAVAGPVRPVTAAVAPVATPKPTVAPAAAAQPSSVAPKQAFRMSGLTDYERWLKMLVYGDPGVGKTRLMASAVLVPEMRDILVIDAEAGDLTIATEQLFQAFKSNFTVVRVKDFTQYARVQEYLKLHCFYRDQDTPEADKRLKDLEQQLMDPTVYDPDEPPKKFYTCITDSLSEVESHCMYQLLGMNDKTRIDQELATMEWGDFRRNHSQMLRAVRAYRDLPMHVLFTCAAGFIQDEQKRQSWSPGLTGKLSRQVQGFMDIVGYMYVTTGENNTKNFNIQVVPNARINAKCRFSNFKLTGWMNVTVADILKSVGLLEKGLISQAPAKS